LKKLSKVISLLRLEYGVPDFDRFDDPLDQLILTILSQNTTWQNCRQTFDRLKAIFRNWTKVMAADVNEIREAIRPGGLANVKARRIKEVLREIHRVNGSLDLSFLRNISDTEAMEFLTSFKGVGPKTAACVLLFSCRKPVLPVDTHILRVSKRLGLIEKDVDFVRAHRLLGELVGRNEGTILAFHVNMIEHGRQVCRAQNPLCEVCSLSLICDDYGRSKCQR
jgi:endonuclease-3